MTISSALGRCPSNVIIRCPPITLREDIGTIKSFFEANLAMAEQPPRFEFYDPTFPIYTGEWMSRQRMRVCIGCMSRRRHLTCACLAEPSVATRCDQP